MQRVKNKNTWKGPTEKLRAEYSRGGIQGTPGKQHEGQGGAGTNTRWSVEGSAAGRTVFSKNGMKIQTGDAVGNYSNTTKRKERSFGQSGIYRQFDARRQSLDRSRRLSPQGLLMGWLQQCKTREKETRCPISLVSGLGLILPEQPKRCLVAKMKTMLAEASYV